MFFVSHHSMFIYGSALHRQRVTWADDQKIFSAFISAFAMATFDGLPIIGAGAYLSIIVGFANALTALVSLAARNFAFKFTQFAESVLEPFLTARRFTFGATKFELTASTDFDREFFSAAHALNLLCSHAITLIRQAIEHPGRKL